MTNYSNPNLTLREAVEACLSTVNARIAALEPVITAIEQEASAAQDSGTAQALTQASGAVTGTKINLQMEADRLQGIIDDWDAQASS